MLNDTNVPDLNVYSFNDHGIFTLEELNELSSLVKPHLSALHLNARSLVKHFDELCNLLDSISDIEFDLIVCSETWNTLQGDVERMQIPGYNLLLDNRTFFNQWRGSLYLKTSFDYSVREDLKINGIENIWVDTHDNANWCYLQPT